MRPRTGADERDRRGSRVVRRRKVVRVAMYVVVAFPRSDIGETARLTHALETIS